MSHLLVTNDFPPKVGGIQTYLWELWRRLPPGEVTILTTPFPGSEEFDATAPMRIVRTREKVLWPPSSLARQVAELASESGAGVAVLDPALPLGRIGRHLPIPYAVVLHGAEITVPARLPVLRNLLSSVISGADGLIAAGHYPWEEAARVASSVPPVELVLPGVDTQRFRVLDPSARAGARSRFEIPGDAELVVSVSRLVPRKGMDTLIAAAARLAPSHPRLVVAIAGAGRDRQRLERLASSTRAPVRFAGRLTDAELPLFYGCADLFVMACRSRWAGLEQEGFGVVFLEAAACGVPQIAGRSGGSHEAVDDGVTGLVLDRADDPAELAQLMEKILGDPSRRAEMAGASRLRVEQSLGYDRLAGTLLEAVRGWEGGRRSREPRRSRWRTKYRNEWR